MNPQKVLLVDENTHREVMLFKVKCKAKNADIVIKDALKLLKHKLKGELKGR